MKAVLVIDIPDDLFIEDCVINYEVKELVMMNQVTCGKKRLRPLPEKLPEVSYDSWWGWNKIFNHVLETLIKVRDFAKGWNACLDDITGETE